MLNELVDRIEVCKREKSQSRKTQQIHIYFNYVGRVELPTSQIPQNEINLPNEPLPETPTFLITEEVQAKSAEDG
jgi:nitrogen-specific signal transduction histidine kinase